MRSMICISNTYYPFLPFTSFPPMIPQAGHTMIPVWSADTHDLLRVCAHCLMLTEWGLGAKAYTQPYMYLG
jgi:hypothetical protein